MASANTANTSKISLVVEQQVPEFVRTDHPKFVTFLQKYYEFMEQYMGTSDLPGTLSASKRLADYRDPDFVDFNLFLDSTRKEFSPTLPSVLANDKVNRRTLYKHLTDFYRSKGSEDSFRLIFRLLFGEEINLYYPKDDMLIASGGDWASYKKMLVVQTSNSAMLENRIITGATSGATAVVERAESLPAAPFTDAANSMLYDTKYLASKEVLKTAIYLNTDSITGSFNIHEKIYTGAADGKVNVVTTVLPIVSNVVLFDDFSTYNANTWHMLAFDDNRGKLSNLAFNVPWDNFGATANIQTVPSEFTSTGNSSFGPWFRRSGNGEIQIVPEENVSGGVVIQVGNNYAPDSSRLASSSDDTEGWDSAQLYYNKNIPYDPTKLYRMTVRARDFAPSGNTSTWDYPDDVWAGTSTDDGTATAGFNRTIHFYGVSGIQGDGISMSGMYSGFDPAAGKVVGNYRNNSSNDRDMRDGYNYVLLYGSPLSPEWFTYETHFSGRFDKGWENHESDASVGGGFSGEAMSDYGLHDVTRHYKSVDNPFKLNHYIEYIRPNLAVNFSTNARYGKDTTQIDYVKIEEISATADVSGEYLDESSLLSSKGGHIQDNEYRNSYAYEIKSENELAQYKQIVKESVHPAGTRLFGNRIQHTEPELSPIGDSNANTQHSFFSPDQMNSLASWWKADSLTAENLQFNPTSEAKGTHETKNWMPVGFSNWESNSLPGMSVNPAIDVELSEDDFYFGKRSLKVTHEANQSAFNGSIWPTGDGGDSANQSQFQTNLSPNKKWVMSAFIKQNDTNQYIISGMGGISRSVVAHLHPANNYGRAYGLGGALPSDHATGFLHPSANNTWERVQGTSLIDLSDVNETKFAFRLEFWGVDSAAHDGIDDVETITHVDGIMLEQYDPTIHGDSHPYTLSEYTPPSFHGANVMSWYDNSINQHHLYANTIALNDNNPNDVYVGGDDDIYNLRPPMYIANAVNGYPAIHMQSPTVNATYWSLQDGIRDGGTLDGAPRQHPANTYRWSPQPSDTVSGILLANTHLGDSSVLVRPVANSWTVLCVAKTNLTSNTRNYTQLQTLIASGHAFTESATDDVNSGGLDLSIGQTSGMDNGVLYTYCTNPTGTNRGAFSTGGKTELVDSNQTAGRRMANTNEFNIIGYSQFSHNGYSTGTEALNFHINGLRFSNNTSGDADIRNSVNAWANNQYNNLERDGFVESLQQGAVTSVGGRRQHDPPTDNPAFQGNFVYGLDGQIAEILVFNQKLANNQIEKVEGYLAHKYGLTDRLYHRDGNAGGTHPYKTNKPPAVGGTSD